MYQRQCELSTGAKITLLINIYYSPILYLLCASNYFNNAAQKIMLRNAPEIKYGSNTVTVFMTY